MLVYIWPSLLTLLLFLILYLIYFFILKPLLAIKFYRDQGVKMVYYPFLGRIKECINSEEATGDWYADWKKMIKQDPKLPIFGGNYIDGAHLYLVDPVMVKDYYNGRENYIKLPNQIAPTNYVFAKSLIASEGELWKRHRKIISAAFRFELLRDRLPDMVKISDQLLEDYKKGDLNNIQMVYKLQTIGGEIVGRVFFGETFGDVRVNGLPVIEFIMKLLGRLTTATSDVPYLIFGTKVWDWGLISRHRKLRDDSREFTRVMTEIIEARKEKFKQRDRSKQPESETTLLDILLAQEASGSDQALDTEEIAHEFINLVAAGSETTGVTVTNALYYLLLNPQYKDRLLEESNKYFTDPSALTIDKLNQMDFMNAFLKESLRVFPPAAVLFDRIALKDHTLGNIKVKKGTVVNVSTICINYSSVHHDDADVFDPDRWLTDSKTKKSINKDPFLYLPFSAGTRNCIGQHLAMITMRINFSLVLKKYDYKLDPTWKFGGAQRLIYEPADPMRYTLIPK